LDGDFEADFLHYAIQKLRWALSELALFLDVEPSDINLKAFLYASTQIRIDAEKKEAEKAKSKGKR
jgi:hypothetical protein